MASPPEYESAQPSRWEFRLLGPLEVLAGGKPVGIAGTRQRAVLALLLLDADRVVPTDRLIDRLWGEPPPPTAITSLHNGIAQLRKALGAPSASRRAPRATSSTSTAPTSTLGGSRTSSPAPLRPRRRSVPN